MTLDQLPAHVREFANYLDGLLARLDQGSGWCAVFWQRDPDGMRACLDGREMPPWDVVEALLQDLAAEHGTPAAAREAERARPLHLAALVAHDDRPGGRDALGDRLDVMLREQRYAVERQAELGRRLAAAATREEADALRLDLAWAHDDHERATARCAELRYRMAEADRRAGAGRRESPAIRRATGAAEASPTASVYDDTPAAPARAAQEDTPAPAAYGATAEFTAPAAYGATAEFTASSGYGATAAAAASSAHGDAPAAPARTPYGDTPEAAPYGDTPEAAPYGDTPEAAPYGDTPEAAPYGDLRRFAGIDSAPVSHQGRHPGAAPVEPAPAAPPPAEPAPAPSVPAPKQRKRRRGSARFAGMVEEEAAAPVVVPPAAGPVQPAPTSRRTLRGARFAGAAETVQERPEPPRPQPPDPVARRETADAVARLVRLRGEGRSGEAHALLAELASWPAARVPLLAAELQRAGLTADWSTLLWEAASLPADRLVAAADALAEAGRTADGEQILRQGVARPAEEIGEAVRALAAQGRRRETRALLDAYVRVRTPEEAARSAAPDPQTLVPLLLEAARGVSDERHWDLVHALRVAGLTT
ncbi:hypothetical protein [Streptomyces sp. NPDC052015]|uniref:hypothetical protein n=1 Tax=Streptomyces sp. NPDC052015 TaxID=3154755 RepID=UPI00341BBA3C